jgi:hypothetical protein
LFAWFARQYHMFYLRIYIFYFLISQAYALRIIFRQKARSLANSLMAYLTAEEFSQFSSVSVLHLSLVYGMIIILAAKRKNECHYIKRTIRDTVWGCNFIFTSVIVVALQPHPRPSWFVYWGRILGRNLDKSLKSFHPCFASGLLFLQTHATSYSFYSSVGYCTL